MGTARSELHGRGAKIDRAGADGVLIIADIVSIPIAELTIVAETRSSPTKHRSIV